MLRMRLKKKKKRKKQLKNKIAVIIFLLFISMFLIFKKFNKAALPQLIEYSKIETSKIVSTIINHKVTDEIANNINTDEIFIILKDSNNNIESIDFNSSQVNKILYKASKSIEESLRYLEKGEIEKLNLNNYISNFNEDKMKKGIIYELPSGIIFNNVLLNNVLPKIPIKINLIGNVFTSLSSDIKSYGINNAFIKVNIDVESEIKILLPFVSSSTKINLSIPIIMKILEGEVPNYYFGGYLNSQTLPVK